MRCVQPTQAVVQQNVWEYYLIQQFNRSTGCSITGQKHTLSSLLVASLYRPCRSYSIHIRTNSTGVRSIIRQPRLRIRFPDFRFKLLLHNYLLHYGLIFKQPVNPYTCRSTYRCVLVGAGLIHASTDLSSYGSFTKLCYSGIFRQ